MQSPASITTILFQRAAGFELEPIRGEESHVQRCAFLAGMGVDGFPAGCHWNVVLKIRLPDPPGHHTLDDLYRLSREPRALGAEDPRGGWEEIFQYQHDQPACMNDEGTARPGDHYPGAVLVGKRTTWLFGNGKDETAFNFKLSSDAHEQDPRPPCSGESKGRLTKIPEGAWAVQYVRNHDSSRMLNNLVWQA